MNPGNVHRVGLATLVLALLPGAGTTAAQIAFEVRLTRTAGATCEIGVEIRSTGATPFVLGTSSFLFQYDTAGLGPPVKAPGVEEPWGAMDDDYEGLRVVCDSLQGYVGLLVEFSGAGGDRSGPVVPQTFTRVGMLSFPVRDTARVDSVAWRNLGTNSQVHRLANPGSPGGGEVEVTVAGTFLLPSDTLVTGVPEQVLPETFAVRQNYPNPFNPSTVIPFDLPSETHVTLEVFNVLGQRTDVLIDRVMPAGRYAVRFEGRHHGSGVYFYRVTTPGASVLKKMLLLR